MGGDGHIATHQILMEIFFGLASKDGQIETRKKELEWKGRNFGTKQKYPR